MKRLGFAAVLGLGVFGVWAATATAGPPAAKGGAKEENCGAMMKQTAALPKKFAELMTAVTDGMTAHANWAAMNKDPKSQAEAAAMKKIADDHRALAAAATKAASDMEAAGTLQPAPHDRSKMDPKAMADQMTKQIALEREMANMMLKHADEGEKMMKEMTAAAPAPASKK
jgi:hypothetical protein